MREIKFRAWYSGEMYENCAVVDGKALRRGHFATDLFSDFSGRAELMQFTGLTDVNGVEIYEGDVVESNAMLPGVVCFDKSNCCFSFGDWSILDFMAMSDTLSLKVIGNIHQNPELLK